MKTKKMLLIALIGGIFILGSSFVKAPTSILSKNNQLYLQRESTYGDITVYAYSNIGGYYPGTATSSLSYPPGGVYNAPITIIDSDGFQINLHNVSHSYDPYTKTYTDGWEGDATDPNTGVEYAVNATITGNYGNWNFKDVTVNSIA